MAIFTDIFEDVTKQGRKIPTSDYHEIGAHPIIDQGQSAIAGYTDETDGLFTDVPAIIFGDHTRVLKYVDTPCFLGADGVKLLKAKIANSNYKYLYYVLSNANIPNTGYNRHFKWLKEVDIPLPNADEQQKIVDTLDKVSELIALRKEQLTKLDQLIKSRFIEMFGDGSYPQIPLIQLIVEGAGLSYGIVVPGDNVEDGVPMVRPSDFNNGELCLDNVYRVAPEIEAKYTRTRLIGNEILVQVIGQPGQVMLSDSRCKGMNVTRNLAVVRPDCNKINRIYLKTYMQSQEAQAFMLGETKQSTLKQLPLTRLKELEIPVPPMELQEQFAAFVEQIDKSKLAIQQSLDKLELLKKSLMQEYFG